MVINERTSPPCAVHLLEISYKSIICLVQVPPLVYFKYEPFILHVETRTYEHARRILGIALQCGFKHSGVVTTQRRHIVHVRANLKIDAPIANVQGGLLVSPQYIRLCVAAANKKMAEVCVYVVLVVRAIDVVVSMYFCIFVFHCLLFTDTIHAVCMCLCRWPLGVWYIPNYSHCLF